MSRPLRMPGRSSGMSTFQKACQGVAPRSMAASPRLGFSCRSLGSTAKTTYGILKVMWATSSVPKPREKPSIFPVNTNSSIRLTPVMMSALVMGMLLMVISRCRGRRFMAWKPMAAAVPRTVAISAASTDTVRVVLNAESISSSWNSS